MVRKGLIGSLVFVASLLILFGFRLYSLRSATAPALSETTTTLPNIQKVIVLAVNDMQNPISEELTTAIKQLVMDNENLRAVILDAQGLRRRQSEQLQQLDRSSLAAVILLPVANLDDLDGPISQLNQAGVPVISLNQPAMDSSLLTAHVIRIGYDALEAGRQQAAFCARQLGGQGQVVILAGPENQGITQQMLSGVREVFRNFPGISVADIQFGDWSRKSGMVSMSRSLQEHQVLSAIIAQNDEMLLGALPLIAEQNSQSVKIGNGATSEGLRSLSQGYIEATISINSRQIARDAFNAVMAAINGDVAADELLQPQLIDSSNLQSYVREIWNIN